MPWRWWKALPAKIIDTTRAFTFGGTQFDWETFRIIQQDDSLYAQRIITYDRHSAPDIPQLELDAHHDVWGWTDRHYWENWDDEDDVWY